MLPGQALQVQDTTTTILTSVTSTQQWIFYRSLKMLPTPHNLHEHASLHTVSLLVLTTSFTTSVVTVIDDLYLIFIF
jgi:hypothetical protein